MQPAVIHVLVTVLRKPVCAVTHKIFPRLGILFRTSNRVPGIGSGTGSGTGGRHQFSGTGAAMVFFKGVEI